MIENSDDHARCVYWFRACVALHNLLLEDYYDPDWDSSGSESETESDDSGDEEGNPDNVVYHPRMNERRKEVFKRNYLRQIVSLFNDD